MICRSQTLDPKNGAHHHRFAKGHCRAAGCPSDWRGHCQCGPRLPRRSESLACRSCWSMSPVVRQAAMRQAHSAREFPSGWTDLIPELNVQPADHKVTKHTWGAFAHTDLDALLKEAGVTQVVPCRRCNKHWRRVDRARSLCTRFQCDDRNRRRDRSQPRRPRKQPHAHLSAPWRDGHDTGDHRPPRKGRLSMQWPHEISYFFGGVFLANAVPHFVSGIMGRPFQSPFAKPPGRRSFHPRP